MYFFCTQFHLSLHAKKHTYREKIIGGGCCCRCYARIQFIHVLLLWGANQLNKKSVTKAPRSMNLNHFCIKLKCNFFESKYWKTKHTIAAANIGIFVCSIAAKAAFVDEANTQECFPFECTKRKNSDRREIQFRKNYYYFIIAHLIWISGQNGTQLYSLISWLHLVQLFLA